MASFVDGQQGQAARLKPLASEFTSVKGSLRESDSPKEPFTDANRHPSGATHGRFGPGRPFGSARRTSPLFPGGRAAW
ncbi:hypothetical protein SAMN05421854_12237 [Amycolatopsis rubida]|uniref:Uncharacterized protein n=1 Tax=Amycolatopsis rubida TaxID=112413 RepID=A0A1I6B0F3_9PSEU|nr:hypothetical protein SAMN05421854_12237 [Amycolatopsis rubida]